MPLVIGAVNHMIVNRKTDIGYMLDLGSEQVFLHNNESLHRELKAGDAVDAFLYFDNKGRLAATLKEPFITVFQPGFLTVTDIKEDLGVFFNMGIAKELLLSHEDLPHDHDQWPKLGDKLYVALRVKGKLVAKLATKNDVKLIPEKELQLKDEVIAYVQKMGAEGVNLLTPDGHWIFVHHTMIKKPLRYGQEVEVKITYHSDKGYTGSLAEQKEVAMFEDANMILSYLVRQGSMPLTSDSSPEDIESLFHISKKAFKRALGHLYKERKVRFEDDKTILVQP